MSPIKILKEICEFLEIDFFNEWTSNLTFISKPVNPSSIGHPIPYKYERILAEMQLENLIELNINLEGSVEKWVNRAREILSHN